jgi:polysaccharide pyruvyl transferase WcaK-like protein
MTKPYIILTGGDGGTGNLGDGFILDAVKSFYKPYQKYYNIIILKQNLPKWPLKDGFIYANDNEQSFKKLNIPTAGIALVHFYGGGYLNIYWYEDKIWLYRHLTEQGLPPKSFVFTGQGLGPFLPKQKKEIRQIAAAVSSFGTRDIAGTREYKNTGFSFDDTISLIEPAPARQSRSKLIGVNLRLQHEHAAMDENYLLKFLKEVDKFASNIGYQLYFFSMIKNDTYSEAVAQSDILERANLKKYKIHERATDYKKLLKRISGSRLIVTTSYHATLASLYSKVPVISLFQNEYYRLKFEGLQESFDSKLLFVNRIDTFKPQCLQIALNAANQSSVRQTNGLIEELGLYNRAIYDTIARRLSRPVL